MSEARLTAGDLQAAGLYDPGAPGAADRLAMLELLVQHGATLEDLQGEALDLGALASRLVIRPQKPTLTRRKLAERTGLPEEMIQRLWLAAGFADPGADVPIATDADAAVFQVFAAAMSIFGQDSTLQLTRVIGAAMAKVADAIVSSFIANVGPVAMADDPSGLALVRANLESSGYLPYLASAMDQLLRMHLVAASRSTSVVDLGYETLRLVVGFVDLVGSTALAQHLDTAQLGAALSEFETRAADVVVGAGGRVVKLIGDEVMFTNPRVDAACATALDLVETFRAHPVLPPVKAGLACGGVLLRDGDCFGPVVNLAARAVKEAEPSEVLVDAVIQASLPAGYRVDEMVERALKGFDSAVALGRLTR